MTNFFSVWMSLTVHKILHRNYKFAAPVTRPFSWRGTFNRREVVLFRQIETVAFSLYMCLCVLKARKAVPPPLIGLLVV